MDLSRLAATIRSNIRMVEKAGLTEAAQNLRRAAKAIEVAIEEREEASG